jgi:peptidoglycan/xylan/chitin deacetylase (PgdA/CDA1 family)
MLTLPIPILMYHSIETMPKSTVMRSLHVPIKRFEFQMWILKMLGYKALSIEGLRPYLNGEKQGKVVGLTFDDGYKNNLINALPIITKFNFSATCYLVSDYIGLNNIWDLEKGINQMPLMSVSEIYQWLDHGMDIGAHSKTHLNLTSLSEEEAHMEIKNCKTDLESNFNVPVKDFCYPYGQFNNSVCDMVKDSGYLSATSMVRGRVHSKYSKFKLPRIPVTHHTLPHLFIAKILTNYEDKR